MDKTDAPGDLIFVLSKTLIPYLECLFERNPLSWPQSVSYYAIGQSTAQAWQKFAPVRIRYPPGEETSEGLLALLNLQSLKHKKALILRGNGGRALLGDTLKKRGTQIIYCECYQRHLIDHDGMQKSTEWQQLKIDTLVVTSGEMLQRIYDLVPEEARFSWLIQCRLIVVSVRLADMAAQLGWHQIHIAQNADKSHL